MLLTGSVNVAVVFAGMVNSISVPEGLISHALAMSP